MGNTTFPLYIYELLKAVIKYEEEHPKVDNPEHGGQWCFQQWLSMIPEEHINMANMIDDIKAYLELRQG